VLVDLALNNPSIAKILNVNQEYSITEFLTGEKEPEEIINRVVANFELKKTKTLAFMNFGSRSLFVLRVFKVKVAIEMIRN
jgi:MinD-like ATPase involved in chromosome partitioning or flagellar assembly